MCDFMTEGIVKSKNLTKKYVVVESESGETVFIPSRRVLEGQKVHVGDKVSFDEEPDETKGKKGKNLRISDYA